MRMYSLLESNLDIDQFLKSIHRYVQIGIHVKGYMSAELQRFQREIVEVCEFYVDDNNEAKTNVIFRKNIDGTMTYNNPTKYIRQILGAQGIIIKDNLFVEHNQNDETFDSSTPKEESKSDSVDDSNVKSLPSANPMPNPVPTNNTISNQGTVNNVQPTVRPTVNVTPQQVNVNPPINNQVSGVNQNVNLTPRVDVNSSEFNFNDTVDEL
jgi:hypothetical protein